MPQKKYQTRLPDDDAERVDEFVEDRDISQAEAVRRLIRAGLDSAADDSTGDQTQRAAQRGTLLAILGLGVAVFVLQLLILAGVTI